MRRKIVIVIVIVIVGLLIFMFAKAWAAPKAIETSEGVVAVSGYDPDRMQAGIAGRLIFNTAGCLALGDDPDEAKTLVLPRGSTVVDDDPLTIRVRGQDFRLGDELTGGGGAIEWDEVYPLPSGIPESCRDGEVLLMNE